jgi:hypothetical protein
MLRVADYFSPARDVIIGDESLSETTRETRKSSERTKRTTTTKRDQDLQATRSDHEEYRLIFKAGVTRGRRGTSSDRRGSDVCGRA